MTEEELVGSMLNFVAERIAGYDAGNDDLSGIGDPISGVARRLENNGDEQWAADALSRLRDLTEQAQERGKRAVRIPEDGG